jgi:hypothetical protein
LFAFGREEGMNDIYGGERGGRKQGIRECGYYHVWASVVVSLSAIATDKAMHELESENE